MKDCFEKNMPEYHVPEWCQLKEFVPRIGFRMLSYSGTKFLQPREESMTTALAGMRPWSHLCGAGFRCLQKEDLWIQAGFHSDFRRLYMSGSVPLIGQSVKL